MRLMTFSLVQAARTRAYLALGHEVLSPAAAQFLAIAFSERGRNGSTTAATLGCSLSMVNSRFARAGLPSPRQLVVHARLVVAADLLERYHASAADVALGLDYSSPQAFARTVHLVTGCTIGTFRATLGGDRMLEQFRTTLIVPYRVIWSSLAVLARAAA